jgi:hypothetical protein
MIRHPELSRRQDPGAGGSDACAEVSTAMRQRLYENHKVRTVIRRSGRGRAPARAPAARLVGYCLNGASIRSVRRSKGLSGGGGGVRAEETSRAVGARAGSSPLPNLPITVRAFWFHGFGSGWILAGLTVALSDLNGTRVHLT